jgi:hypothetical protein
VPPKITDPAQKRFYVNILANAFETVGTSFNETTGFIPMSFKPRNSSAEWVSCEPASSSNATLSKAST